MRRPERRGDGKGPLSQACDTPSLPIADVRTSLLMCPSHLERRLEKEHRVVGGYGEIARSYRGGSAGSQRLLNVRQTQCTDSTKCARCRPGIPRNGPYMC